MKQTLNTPLNSILYEGNIHVRVLRNNKVIREKTFQNNGRWPLFSHLVSALAGQYSEAEKNRPLVIGIYTIDYEDTPNANGAIPEINDSGAADNKISKYANSANLRSGSPGMFMTAPEVKVTENAGIGTATVTYDFLVPFNSLIFTNSGGWDSAQEPDQRYKIDPLCLVCLYSKSNYWNANSDLVETKTYGNPSAFFFVPNEDHPTLLGSLLPKDMSASSNEYSLEIKWVLTFDNKPKSNSNN